MSGTPPRFSSFRGRERAAPIMAALVLAMALAPATPAFADPSLGRVQKLEAREDGARTIV